MIWKLNQIRQTNLKIRNALKIAQNLINPSQSLNQLTTISQDQNQLNPSEQVRNKPVNTRSQRTCIPTRYIREIQSGIGTMDGRPRKTDLPTGIQVPAPITEIEGENEDKGQLEHAMAAAISEIKVINPQSLEEVMRRPD